MGGGATPFAIESGVSIDAPFAMEGGAATLLSSGVGSFDISGSTGINMVELLSTPTVAPS